ncbi:hypothetical protein TW65_05645 [Stemphylium lycopersici]|nr:hypothetical protein TW65_05645 [Stemphylium lycopersici]
MAACSADFLEIDQNNRYPSLHRSRSGSYVDHLEEKTKWDRRDRDRAMKRYHDSKHGTLSSSNIQKQSSTPDRLNVPVFGRPNRFRSSSDAGARDQEPGPKYNVQEVRPSPKPKPTEDYDLNSEVIRPSQLPVKYERRPPPPDRPRIKVEIHQEISPSFTTSDIRTPKRSPSASPRSTTAQPQSQFQYATLQHKLDQISRACVPYIDVEAANPQDLTFEKISERAKAFSFDLQVWAHVANLDGMAKIDPRKRDVVDAASQSLDRLEERIAELNEAILKAKPRDLKFSALSSVDDETLFDDEEDMRYLPTRRYDVNLDANNSSDEPDPTESLGFIIHSSLHSIELQMQNLKRLSRTLQEATPDAKEEVVAVAKLVTEIVKYFGSEEALNCYSIDERFAGRKGLEEARFGDVR